MLVTNGGMAELSSPEMPFSYLLISQSKCLIFTLFFKHTPLQKPQFPFLTCPFILVSNETKIPGTKIPGTKFLLTPQWSIPRAIS